MFVDRFCFVANQDSARYPAVGLITVKNIEFAIQQTCYKNRPVYRLSRVTAILHDYEYVPFLRHVIVLINIRCR
jgi:hypothetical protein